MGGKESRSDCDDRASSHIAICDLLCRALIALRGTPLTEVAALHERAMDGLLKCGDGPDPRRFQSMKTTRQLLDFSRERAKSPRSRGVDSSGVAVVAPLLTASTTGDARHSERGAPVGRICTASMEEYASRPDPGDVSETGTADARDDPSVTSRGRMSIAAGVLASGK